MVAHSRCNNRKRDFLAATPHLERWAHRLASEEQTLGQIAEAGGWPCDRDRSLNITRSIYLHLPDRVPLWLQEAQLVQLDRPAIERALAAL